jgi:hypothetical protein
MSQTELQPAIGMNQVKTKIPPYSILVQVNKIDQSRMLKIAARFQTRDGLPISILGL